MMNQPLVSGMYLMMKITLAKQIPAIMKYKYATPYTYIYHTFIHTLLVRIEINRWHQIRDVLPLYCFYLYLHRPWMILFRQALQLLSMLACLSINHSNIVYTI